MEVREDGSDRFHYVHPPNHVVELLNEKTCFPSRSMHYPPETSSIMLMARMVATVKQVIYYLTFIRLHFVFMSLLTLRHSAGRVFPRLDSDP